MAAGGGWMKRICPCFTPPWIALADSARETVSLSRLAMLSTRFFFVWSKRLYDIHVTWFDRFLHRKRARGPLVFRGPTQLAYSAYRADRLCRCVWLGRHTKCAVLGGRPGPGLRNTALQEWKNSNCFCVWIFGCFLTVNVYMNIGEKFI